MDSPEPLKWKFEICVKGNMNTSRYQDNREAFP
jgi:hypothetical protein